MKKQLEANDELKRTFERQLQGLWPALKGSLAKIHKPCIRKTCPTCARGDKHPAWILSISQAGRRQCLYVPEDLVPLLQLAIRNGRRVEDLLQRMGPALVNAYRKQRDAKKKRRP